ncbi:hypothetical protein ACP70R_034437 [Stipagrostis hirtigluma subsp. patula]
MDGMSGMANPIFSPEPSSSSTSTSSSATSSPPHPPLPSTPASVIRMVNIRSHIPITLNLQQSNYSQWSSFFDSVFGKFGLQQHVTGPHDRTNIDAEWYMIDQSIVNWLYTTIFTEIFNMVHKPKATVYSVWGSLVHVVSLSLSLAVVS